MKLWVANTTKQNHHFTFRLPLRGDGFRAPLIKAGQQICIDDHTSDEIKEIIRQNERYGLIDAAEFSRRGRKFVGRIYSIDAPVQMDQMLQTFEGNDHALEEQARERQVLQGAAVQDAIAQNIHQRFGIDKEAARPDVTVETIEDTTDGTPSISMGVEVPSKPDAEPRRAGKKR